jgi:AraC family transcriptional regulator
VATHLATGHLGAPPPTAGDGALSASQFRKVREFLRENLHRDLRLAEIAGVVGLSTFHFARAFKAAAGASPHRFLLEQRLNTACRLLEATDLSIGEISRAAGFQSLTGFGAAFRRRWSVSPSRYRRSVRG